MVGIAAKVQDLHRDLATGIVYGLRHDLVFGGLFFGGHARATGHRAAPVERDAELVTWLLPAIRARLSPAAAAKPCDVVVGDAREVLPTLTADVALVDIFPHYGRNHLRTPCPGIRKVWCWGAALVRPR